MADSLGKRYLINACGQLSTSHSVFRAHSSHQLLTNYERRQIQTTHELKQIVSDDVLSEKTLISFVIFLVTRYITLPILLVARPMAQRIESTLGRLRAI